MSNNKGMFTGGDQPQISQQAMRDIMSDPENQFTCDNCGGKYFKQQHMIVRIPKFYTGSPKDAIQPIPVFRCGDCGMPLSETMMRHAQRDEEEGNDKNDDDGDNIIDFD